METCCEGPALVMETCCEGSKKGEWGGCGMGEDVEWMCADMAVYPNSRFRCFGAKYGIILLLKKPASYLN